MSLSPTFLVKGASLQWTHPRYLFLLSLVSFGALPPPFFFLPRKAGLVFSLHATIQLILHCSYIHTSLPGISAIPDRDVRYQKRKSPIIKKRLSNYARYQSQWERCISWPPFKSEQAALVWPEPCICNELTAHVLPHPHWSQETGILQPGWYNTCIHPLEANTGTVTFPRTEKVGGWTESAGS